MVTTYCTLGFECRFNCYEYIKLEFNDISFYTKTDSKQRLLILSLSIFQNIMFFIDIAI